MIEWMVGGLGALLVVLVVVRNRQKKQEGKAGNVMAIPDAATVAWALHDLGMSDPTTIVKWIRVNRKRNIQTADVEDLLKHAHKDVFIESSGMYDLSPGMREQMDPRT